MISEFGLINLVKDYGILIMPDIAKKSVKRIPLIIPLTFSLVNATLTRSTLALSLDFNKSKQKAAEMLIENDDKFGGS